jgi:two-component system sensor histidine kinase/response regulator
MKRRILVADDEEFCLSATQAVLKQIGIDVASRVDFCISGSEAVDLIKLAYRNSMDYQLILTDFAMPGMDGLEATKQIRRFLKEEQGIERENQPPIIGITGHV